MNCSIGKRTWGAIYRLLNRVSPVAYDCGTLCGAACCVCNDEVENKKGGIDEMGIYLYPGEHLLHTHSADWLEWSNQRAEEYDFPDSWVGTVSFVRCKTPPICPREMRPLQCRTFPLKPYLDEDGVLSLLYDFDELPYSCPIIEKSIEIEDDFYKATYTVWSHLIRDELIYDLVEMDSRLYDEMTNC